MVSVAAKQAWVSALRSSPSATANLMTIISALGANLSETLSVQALVLTTETNDCGGKSDKSLPVELKEPSSK